MSELADWAASVVNRYIDVDGSFGNQCWDASQSWLFAVAGPDATLWTQPSNYPGLAAGCWETVNSDVWPGPAMRKYVTPIPGDQPGMPGDIVIWHYGARLYPISHTAVLLEDRGANLYIVSQNSSPGQPELPGYSTETTGPAIYQLLPREGIAGFLRPNVLSAQSGTITPLGDEIDMATLDELRQLIREESLTKADGGAIQDSIAKTLNKGDGAYLSKILTDQSAALGRIEKQLATTLNKADGAYLVGQINAMPGKTPAATGTIKIDVQALAADLAPLLNAIQVDQFIAALRNLNFSAK